MKPITVPESVLNAIRRHPSFFVVPHQDPDGDCIGSALALDSFLRRIGKRTRLHNLGPFEKRDVRAWANRFAGRVAPELIAAEPDAAVVVLDCSTIDRIGELADDLAGLPVIVIDHHSAGVEFGSHRFVAPDSPSTSLLVQALIEAYGETVTREEADYIFFAFCTDTGFFRHLESGTGPAFEHVARLADAGASPKKVFAQLNSGVSLEGRRHLGRLLARTEPHAGGKLLVCWEYKAETEAVGKANRDSDLLYQMLTGIEGVEAVAMLREETPGATVVGLRSRLYLDVGRVALQFGGGGHARAAGFMAEVPLDELRPRLIAVLEAALAVEA